MSTALLPVVLISSVAYILGGLFVFLKKSWSQDAVLALTAMSAGLLLSISILDLIPDTLEALKNSSLYIMLGLILMYLASYLSKVSNSRKPEQAGFDHGSMLGISFGMSLHNFFEGLSIGVSYAISMNLGILVSLALVLHKLPEGMTYSSLVFVLTGNRKKTTMHLLAQGVWMWVGLGCSVLLSHFTKIDERFIAIPIAMTAGIFLYLGGTALLPVANKLTSRKIPISFVSAVLIYLLLHSLSVFLG